MNPDEPNKPVDETLAELESEPPTVVQTVSEPEVPKQVQPDAPVPAPKKAPAGLLIGLVAVTLLLLGTAGYFIGQTVQNVTQGTSQTPVGGDTPDLEGKVQN